MQLQGYLQNFYAYVKYASTITLSSIQMRAETIFRQCDQLFKVTGQNDLCYLAKRTPIKDLLSYIVLSAVKVYLLKMMFRLLCKHTRRCTLQAHCKDKKNVMSLCKVHDTKKQLKLETHNMLADRILNKGFSLSCWLVLYLRAFSMKCIWFSFTILILACNLHHAETHKKIQFISLHWYFLCVFLNQIYKIMKYTQKVVLKNSL